MASKKQIESNKMNSQKSTGPRSSKGKAIVARNAVVHGLRAETAMVIPGESAQAWEEYRAGIIRSLAPADGLELELAERAAILAWRLRRVSRYEVAHVGSRIEAAGQEKKSEISEMLEEMNGETNRDTRIKNLKVEIFQRKTRLKATARILEIVQLLEADNNDGSAVDGSDVGFLFSDLNDLLPKKRQLDIWDESFLQFLPEKGREDPDNFEDYTLGHVRAGIELIAQAGRMASKDLLEKIRKDYEEDRASSAVELPQLEEDLAKTQAEKELLDEKERKQRVIPDKEPMDQIIRYEAHLSKQLQTTLHTVERLQALRAGLQISPPAVVDIAIQGNENNN